MGTVFQVPWTYIGEKKEDGPRAGLERLHKLGFATAAMALDDRAVSIDDPRLERDRLALVLGTEGDGLDPETIARCDCTVCIPMAHGCLLYTSGYSQNQSTLRGMAACSSLISQVCPAYFTTPPPARQ